MVDLLPMHDMMPWWTESVCVCVEEEIGVAHTWHSTLQDKYMADMDELFSQVDEKRKVRIPGSSWAAAGMGTPPLSSSSHLLPCAVEARYP